MFYVLDKYRLENQASICYSVIVIIISISNIIHYKWERVEHCVTASNLNPGVNPSDVCG